jgi:hypothetical protein
MAVDDGHLLWTEGSWLVASVPVTGGGITELQRYALPDGSPADVSSGIAAAGGAAFFGYGRGSASLRETARDGSSARILQQMKLPKDANAFIAQSIAVDATRVYWFDYWWSYSAPKHHAIIRSAPR